MNFFEAQARAKRHTGWLLLLFTLAVAGLIVLTNLLVLGVILYSQTGRLQFSPEVIGQYYDGLDFVAVGLLVILFVLLGSLYKTLALAGGGSRVAEMLGGVLIPRNTADLKQRRLLNVVEEMAIAAGIPVPPVYLLDESGINAFAAGWSPNNAVIGITRGALSHLSRDELQGVIAHEFGHIFNGDMRINIRLIGVLHGILLLGMAGYYLLRVTRYLRSSSRNEKGGNIIIAILVLGVGLVVVGYVGHFFGQWIKAVISRQREYLADATAVRYTRNRDGIAGALKKIGGLARGSLLDAPAAPQYSHACFAMAISGFLPSLFSTHPPLKDRIKRIDPQWDGQYILPVKPEAAEAPAATATPAAMSGVDAAILGGAVAAGVLSPNAVIDHIGQVDEQQVATARRILADIPEALRSAAEEPFGARAVIYGLLLDSRAEIRALQQDLLKQQADPAVVALVDSLTGDIENLPEHAGLPLLELALPALRTLALKQYRQFNAVVTGLIQADRKVNFHEWILQRFVLQQLDEAFGLRKRPREKVNHIGAVKQQAEIVLSMLAAIEHDNPAEAEQAFYAATKETGITAFRYIPRQEISLQSLNDAVDALAELKPLIKPRILKACVVCIMQDGEATIRGQELLRTLASCLDSPVPPLGSIATNP